MKHLALPLTLILVGCSSSGGGKTSTLVGTVAAGFPNQPSAVRATDEAGTLTRAQLGANGAFQLTLDKGHSYRLDVVGTTVEPVVFPRASGALDTVFHISGAGARVALGQVRHFDALPSGGFSVVGQVTSALMSTTNQADQCVGGAMQGSGAACANDNTTSMTCEEQEDDGETEDGEAADGECVNGKDSVTGLACTDAHDDPADPAKPMAVPDQDVPGDVGGCDDGEEED
jgi:hypothetical protein